MTQDPVQGNEASFQYETPVKIKISFIMIWWAHLLLNCFLYYQNQKLFWQALFQITYLLLIQRLLSKIFLSCLLPAPIVSTRTKGEQGGNALYLFAV